MLAIYERTHGAREAMKKKLDKWAVIAGVRLEFITVTKYLQEVDISTSEKVSSILIQCQLLSPNI